MSNKYIRHQSVINRNSDEKIEEDHWLKQFEKNLQKGAVQPYYGQSLFDQINSVMNSKSKYPSVQAAVDDMQERSGLKAYLEKMNKISEEETSETKKTASNALLSAAKSGNWNLFGKLMGQIDNANGNRQKAVEVIITMRYNKDPDLAAIEVPKSDWINFTFGYGEGAKLSPEQQKADIKFTESVLKNLSNRMKKATDNNKAIDKKVDLQPIIIKKFPSIASTINNYIRQTKGNLPVPAIIDKIRSIHQSDVSDAKDWEDENLLRLVSKLNLEAKSSNPDNFVSYQNLGTHDNLDDSEIDPSNTDAFHALNPAKI